MQPGQALLLLEFTALSPSEDTPSSWGQSQLQWLAAKALFPLTLVLHQDLQNVRIHVTSQPDTGSEGVASSSAGDTGLSKATQEGLEASEVLSDPPKSKDSNLSYVCALPGESHPKSSACSVAQESYVALRGAPHRHFQLVLANTQQAEMRF